MANAKTTLKKVSTVAVLILSILISSLVAFSTSSRAAESAGKVDFEGKTFAYGEMFTLSQHITPSDKITFETEIFIPEANREARGMLISNYADSGISHPFAFEIGSSTENCEGKLRVYSKGYADMVFDTVLASETYMGTDDNPKFLHVAVTIDPTVSENNAALYLNGSKVETRTIDTLTSGMYDTSKEGDAGYLVVGNDRCDSGAMYFRGYIKNIAMYSGLRSDTQIASDKASGFYDTADQSLLFAYDLTVHGVNEGYFNDRSPNANNANNINWTPDGIGRAFTSSDALYLSKDLEVMPQTFEAVVYAPKTNADGTELSRTGVIFGNYHGSEACLNFELHSSGTATIHLDPDYSTKASAAKIADVRSDAGFVHIAIVRNKDAQNGASYSLYVDGEFVKTIQGSVSASDKADLDMAEVQNLYKFALGRDSRAGNEQYFKGRIKKLALYSDSLSANQILSSYENGGCESNGNYILKYDMTELESANYVRDLSGNEHHATQNGIALENFVLGRGFDEKDEIYIQKPLTSQPKTYEAWVFAPSAVSRTGVIIGNYGSASPSLLNFEIYSKGAPSVYIRDDNGNLMDKKFNYSINNDEWSHVVITHEYLSGGGAKFTCYVNGVQVDSFDTELAYRIEDLSTLTSLSLGRDSRSENEQYFKGRIKNVALYSDVLTPEEIMASYENGINTDDENLMLCYNLQGKDGVSSIEDSSGNGYVARSIFYENEKPLVLGEDYAYSFAVVGDTQKLVLYDDDNGTDYASYIYDWIAKNKTDKNIQFVMGLGDITDKNRDTEWAAVVEHLKKLENADIDYSLVQGNHDTVAKLDTYFANNTNFTNADIGYYSGSSLGNYYIRFNACDKDGNVKDKYMVVVLQYGPNDAILDWAGGVIAENPTYKVIITTHAYMYRDGTTLDINDVVPPRFPSEKTATDNAGYNNNGDQIWTKLASQYPNVVLALGGHDPYANIARRQDLGVNGNTVTQMLIDFQTADTTYKYETGMVAMFYFSADGKQVKVEYISTYKSNEQNKDVIYNAYLNQFEFSIPDPQTQSDVEVSINGVDGYIVPGMYSNEVTYPFVAFRSDKGFIGAYGDLGGATQAAKGEGVSGNYLILMRRDAEQNIKSDGLSAMTGSITVDLGGYTLYKTGVGYIFDIYLDNNSSSSSLVTDENGNTVDVRGTFRVNNGTVVSYTKDLPLIGINYGAKLMYTYSVSFEFNEVTFIDKLDNNDKNTTDPGYNIFATWENGYTSITGEQHVEVDATFNDCTFDYKSSADGTKMIYLSNVDGYDRTVYDVKINGGNVLLKSADNLSGFVVSDRKTEDRTDKVTYGRSEGGNYTTVTAPQGSTLPEFDANGGELTLIEFSTDGTTTTYILVPTASIGIEYTPKASITLDSNLIFNIYIPEHEGLISATFDGKSVTLTGAEDGYYKASVELAAKEAARELTLVVVLDIDGTEIKGTFTFSLPKYAKTLLATEGIKTEEQTLIKDILAYVRSAYVYFNGASSTDGEIVAIDEVLGSYTATLTEVENTTTSDDKNILAGVTFVLEATPRIRFYLPKDANVNDYTFKIGNSVLEYTTGKEENDATYKDLTYVDISLYAYRMIENITITKGDATSYYHINTYVDGVAGGDEALKSIVEKFYIYCYSAAAYRTAATN